MEGHWGLDILIGLPIFGVVVLVCVVGIVMGLISRRRDPGYSVGGVVAIMCGIVIVLLLALILSPAVYYPYKKEYHYWQPVQGQVQVISKRLVGTGSGMEEKFVVVLKGSKQQYAIEDTRASLVKEGDSIKLSCIKRWQYASVHGYDCRWNG